MSNTESQSIVYSLQGQSLEVAQRIHEAYQHSQEDLAEIEDRVEQFRSELMETFEKKHADTFRSLFHDMSEAICIPVEDLKTYHLDLTHMETHSLAILQKGPVIENVVSLNVDQPVLADY